VVQERSDRHRRTPGVPWRAEGFPGYFERLPRFYFQHPATLAIGAVTVSNASVAFGFNLKASPAPAAPMPSPTGKTEQRLPNLS